MTGPDRLRDIVNRMLEAVLQTLAQESKGGALGQAQVNAVFDRFIAGDEYSQFYEDAYQDLLAGMSVQGIDCRRLDPFGRLMVQPLCGLFDADLFERDILPNLFTFFRMVLGDDETRFGQDCQAIVDRLKAQAKDSFIWDQYYRDTEARKIYAQVLLRIANLFKRWDLRKDWFLKLMQYTPTTSSLGPMAFQVREPASHDGSPPLVFGEAEFTRMFKALFDEFARLTPSELTQFCKEFGDESVKQIETMMDRL